MAPADVALGAVLLRSRPLQLLSSGRSDADRRMDGAPDAPGCGGIHSVDPGLCDAVRLLVELEAWGWVRPSRLRGIDADGGFAVRRGPGIHDGTPTHAHCRRCRGLHVDDG